MSRDAKQEALDFLESLEESGSGDHKRNGNVPASNPAFGNTNPSKPTFKPFSTISNPTPVSSTSLVATSSFPGQSSGINSRNPSPSKTPTPSLQPVSAFSSSSPNQASSLSNGTGLVNTNSSPFRPPSSTGFVPAGFASAPPVKSASTAAPPPVSGFGSQTIASVSVPSGGAGTAKTSKHVFHDANTNQAVAPPVALPVTGIHNLNLQQPHYPPPTTQQHHQQQEQIPPVNPTPPPLSSSTSGVTQQSSASSSKRVHAFVPGMKPASSTMPVVPGFAGPNSSSGPASFPIGDPLVDYAVQHPHSNPSQPYQQYHDHQPQQDQDSSQGWSWGTSLWTTAQKGLESAKTIAGTAAQTLQQSETVKGLVKNYKPELEKLGNVIAPPLSFGGEDGGNGDRIKFPNGLTVWLCLSLPPSLVGERVLRMAKQSMREMWSGKLVPHHPGASVHFVDDTVAAACSSVHQAVIKSEETMEKLQKLANGHVGDTKHVLFAIQPFNTTLQSTMLETSQHVQFYCCLVCDVPTTAPGGQSSKSTAGTLVHAACVSQSVPDNGDDADWQSEMYSRVLETAVSDLVEEFSIKVLKSS